MKKFSLDNILKIERLKDELELERATLIYNKLRWMVKDEIALDPIRVHLKTLIKNYEIEFWNDLDKVSEVQIVESDQAEAIITEENLFIQNRKKLIKEKLNQYELKQQDLGKILGHRKNYMSELINGIRPFSKRDIVVIHSLLKISWEYLIPPHIPNEIKNQINMTLENLNKPNLRLTI